jgi:hypothetical protein
VLAALVPAAPVYAAFFDGGAARQDMPTQAGNIDLNNKVDWTLELRLSNRSTEFLSVAFCIPTETSVEGLSVYVIAGNYYFGLADTYSAGNFPSGDTYTPWNFAAIRDFHTLRAEYSGATGVLTLKANGAITATRSIPKGVVLNTANTLSLAYKGGAPNWQGGIQYLRLDRAGVRLLDYQFDPERDFTNAGTLGGGFLAGGAVTINTL